MITFGPRLASQSVGAMQPGLAGITVNPSVGLNRIPPEEFLYIRRVSCHNELVREPENIRIRGPLIAVGPIAPVKQPVGTKGSPDVIQSIPISFDIQGHATSNAPYNPRNFREQPRSLPEQLQTSVADFARGRVFRGRQFR